MELTVLVDNNTLIDRYFAGEPGFAVYIHDGGEECAVRHPGRREEDTLRHPGRREEDTLRHPGRREEDTLRRRDGEKNNRSAVRFQDGEKRILFDTWMDEKSVLFDTWMDEKSVLFDTGYSDLVVRNALAMGTDLMQIDAVVLSHGHIDHTGGLPALLQHRLGAAVERRAAAAPLEFVFHPAALAVRTAGGLGNIGTQVSREALESAGTLRETKEPLWLSGSMVFLGEIPTAFAFEARPALGQLHLPGGTVPDLVPDDSGLACLTDAGLVVVTGCAHAGICSVVEYAKEVTGCDRVADIIGGFHLYNAPDERIRLTAEYLKEIAPAALHPCHCTGKRAVCRLAGVAPGEEVGVGLRLEY